MPVASKLSDNSKNLLARLKVYCKWSKSYYCRWKACVAVSEMASMPNEEKYRMVTNTWAQTVNALLAPDSSILMRCERPTPNEWGQIKNHLLNAVASGENVSLF